MTKNTIQEVELNGCGIKHSELILTNIQIKTKL